MAEKAISRSGDVFSSPMLSAAKIASLADDLSLLDTALEAHGNEQSRSSLPSTPGDGPRPEMFGAVGPLWVLFFELMIKPISISNPKHSHSHVSRATVAILCFFWLFVFTKALLDLSCYTYAWIQP